MKKAFFLPATILILGLYGYVIPQAVTGSDREKIRLLEIKIENLHIHAENVPNVRSKIAYEFKIPIGIEVSPDDDLLKATPIRIDLVKGDLNDVFESIVRQTPYYYWTIKDRVINFSPKSPYIDAITSEVLDTSLHNFSIANNTSRLNFRESLTSNSQIRKVLKKYEILTEDQVFISRDLSSLGLTFSLNTLNITVRTLLNGLIEESQTKFWIVSRYGKNKQFFRVNL